MTLVGDVASFCVGGKSQSPKSSASSSSCDEVAAAEFVVGTLEVTGGVEPAMVVGVAPGSMAETGFAVGVFAGPFAPPFGGPPLIVGSGIAGRGPLEA